MSSMSFNLHLASGSTVNAMIFTTPDNRLALSLKDDNGKPYGRSKVMDYREAQEFVKVYNECKPGMRESLLWAKLGYGMKDRREKAANIRRVA